MAGLNILGFLAGMNVKLVLGATVFVILLVLMYYLFVFRPSVKTVEKAKIGREVKALIIDDSTNTISSVMFKEIGNNVYGSTSGGKPLFLVVPPGTKSYRCGTDICYIAYGTDVVLVPLDPTTIGKISTLLSTDEFVKINEEDVRKVLRKIFELEDKKNGVINVSPDLKINMAFDIKRVIRELLHKTLGGAGLTIQHFFRTMGNIEEFERYIRAMSEYQAKKYSWLWAVGVVIFMLLLGLGLFIAIKGGGMGVHKP